jgi:hypothetical protein
MNILVTSLLALFAFKVLAEVPAAGPNKTPSTIEKKDKEAEENIKKLFLDTLDPAAILKDLPPKFIELKDIEGVEFETMGNIYVEKNQTITLPGFLYRSSVDPIGTLTGGINGEEMLGPSTRILVRVEGNLEKEKHYSILRLGRVFKHPNSGSWYHYIYVGDATLTDFENKKQAVISTDSPTVTMKDDLLVPLLDTQRKLNLASGEHRPFKDRASIISLQEEDSKVAGENNIVFLDKGSRDGLVINQVLNIYPDAEIRKLKGTSSRTIGTVQIVDTTQETSTGYILKSRDIVHIGDYATGE